MRLLKAESSKFYNNLFNHGEKCTNHTDYKIESLFGDLQDLSLYINRINTVIRLAIQQISSLAKNTHGEIYLPLFMENFIDMFIILVTLDEIISAQSVLIEQWKVYRVKVRSVIHNATQLNIPEIKVLMYEKLLKDLHVKLFTKNLFLNAIEFVMDVPKNSSMCNHMVCFLKNTINDLENKINDNASINKIWIQANVGIVLAIQFFGLSDKRLLKRVMEVNKKLYAVTLVGNIVWLPNDFLAEYLPKEGITALPPHLGEKLLSLRIQKLPTTVSNLVQKSILWCVEMQNLHVKTGIEIFSQIEQKRNLLLELLALTRQMQESISFVTNLHAFLQKPMSRSMVELICRLVEVQKCLEMTFHSMGPAIVVAQSQVVQQLSYQILTITERSRQSLSSKQREKGYRRERLDALSLLATAARLLAGPASSDRRTLTRCALACASLLAQSFREEDLQRLRSLLDTRDMIAEMEQHLLENCSAAYDIARMHQSSLLPAYLGLEADRPDGCVGHLVHWFGAASDGDQLREQRSVLVRTLLEPGCRKVEARLRLLAHALAHHGGATKPERDVGCDAGQLVRVAPLHLDGNALLSTQRFIEHYLDTTLYNLATVTPHDWWGYRAMQALASRELGLKTVRASLPSRSEAQDPDALDIMRNISAFISRYRYSLHSQTFVEQRSSARYLGAVGIRHIADSIRAHGGGICSTSVNFVYQLLRVKLHSLSQFLFDEHIKSRLARDVRFVRTQRERAASPPYTFERAERFQAAIRKLGMTPDGLSYLDQFRELLSQIGNALGYVRLIRSASLHAGAGAVAFLPGGRRAAETASSPPPVLSGPARGANERLEADLGDLVRSFSNSDDYFRLLVDVFAPAFRDASTCQHLQQFYAIVPPLTLSFVDSSLTNKDKLFKKNSTGAAFCDDGFAVGVAYVNALLDQSAELDGLQWFKTADDYLATEQNRVERDNAQDDEKLQQTRVLTLKRLQERRSELRLLYFSLSGARGFFQQPGT